jgi:hypothetical protein
MAEGHDCNGILIGAVSATAARVEGAFNAIGHVNWNFRSVTDCSPMATSASFNSRGPGRAQMRAPLFPAGAWSANRRFTMSARGLCA